MVYAGGKYSEEKTLQVKQIAANPEISDDDRDRILKALSKPFDIDYIFEKHLMHEKKPEKARIKERLLLSIAWEIAKADQHIDQTEIELHDRMAKIFEIENNYCKEVRALLTPNLSTLQPEPA
jgi:uncharacterized tellurite resistance protein B-like protein